MPNNKLKAEILNFLNERVKDVQKRIKATKIDPIPFTEVINLIENAIESAQKVNLIDFKEFQQTLNNLNESIFKEIQEISDFIVDKINNEPEKHLGLLQDKVERINQLRQIKGIKVQSMDQYQQSVQCLMKFIQRKRQDVQSILEGKTNLQEINVIELNRNVQILEQAKWMNEIEDGSIQDIRDEIKKKFKSLLQELDNQLFKVNLSIENTKDFKQFVLILQQLKQYEQIQQVVPEIEHKLNDIQQQNIKLFQNIQDQVVEIFKKEEEKLNIQNIEKAEASYSFYKQLLQTQVQQYVKEINFQKTFDIIEDNLMKYIERLDKEIKSSIQLFQSLGDMDQENVTQNVQIIRTNLKIFQLIAQKRPIIQQYFVEKYDIYLNDHYKSLKMLASRLGEDLKELIRDNKYQELIKKMKLIRIMIDIDRSLEDEYFFNKLYQENQSQLGEQLPIDLKEIVQMIEDNKFSQLETSIIEFISDDPQMQAKLKQIKKKYQEQVQELTETTQRQCKMIDYSQEDVTKYEEIALVLKNLKKASKLGEPLQKEEEKQEIIMEINKTFAKLSDTINKQILQIEKMMQNTNVYKAKQQIMLVQKINRILDQNEKTPEFEEKLKKLEDMLDKIVQDKKEDLKVIDIYKLSSNPPLKFIQRLEEDKNNYENDINQIIQIINEKFQKEIDEIKNKRTSTQQKQNLFQKLKKQLKYVPKYEVDQIAADIEEAIQDVFQSTEQNKEQIDSFIKNESLQDLKDMVQNNKDDPQFEEHAKKIQDFFKSQIKDWQNESIKLINSENVLEVFRTFDQFQKIKNNYPIDFPMNPDNIIFDYSKEFKAQVQKQVNLIKNYLKDNDLQEKNAIAFRLDDISEEEKNQNQQQKEQNTIVQNIQIKVEFLIAFYHNKEQSKYIVQQQIFDDVEDTIIKIIQRIETIQNEYLRHKNRFQDLGEQDIARMQQVITLSREYDQILQIIQKEYQSQSQIFKDLNITKAQIKSIEDGKKYKTIVNDVTSSVKELQTYVQDYLIDVEKLSKNQNERENEVADLNKKLIILNASATFQGVLEQKVLIQGKQSIKIFAEKFNQSISQAFEVVKKPDPGSGELQRFSETYKVLQTFRTKLNIKSKIIQYREQMEELDRKIEFQIESKLSEVEPTNQADKIAIALIDVKKLSENIKPFKARIEQKLDDKLRKLKNSENGASQLSKIGRKLDGDITGKQILKDQSAFSGVNVSILNQKFKTHGIDYILDNLKGNLIDKARLKKRYEQAMNEYTQIVEAAIKGQSKLEDYKIKDVVAKIKAKAGEAKVGGQITDWTDSKKAAIPVLLGQLFGLWTLLNSNHYFQAYNEIDNDSYLLQPHAGQVCSILRILSIGDADKETNQALFGSLLGPGCPKDKWPNNLVEIGTGEGKSVTLAITSSILALIGFDAYSVCYSSYLCERDYQEFEGFFKTLNLQENIKYMTFNKLCEFKINERGAIREMTRNAIQGKEIVESEGAKSSRPKVLLIDEVDVFFQKEFYGNMYQPQSFLQSLQNSNFIDYLWSQSNATYKQVTEWKQYKDLVASYPGWELLIEETIKTMIYDLKDFLKGHEYIVLDDKIGYKEQDKVEFNINYGYKTMFAYYKAHQEGKITEESLKNQKGLKLYCGGFSFALIPSEFFRIVGVTGTLATLTRPERDIVENDYNIKHFTYIPSAFGANQRQFNEEKDFFVENEADWYNQIVRQIETRMNPSSGIQLALIVFFDTVKKLEEFYKSEAFLKFKTSAYTLTELDTDDDKKQRITYATVKGTLTLMTTSFGRGTDFVCADQMVQNNGGLQLIITFFPEEYSEQVQLQGRTARQGQFGRYSFVLLDKELEKYVGPQYKEEINKNKSNLYKFISEQRNSYFLANYNGNKRYVKECEIIHNQSINFRDNLLIKNIEPAKKFLIEQNLGPKMQVTVKACKAIIVMDATGSMGGLIQKAKQTVKKMFDRAYQIIKNKGIEDECLSMMFVVYRNYPQREPDLLQASSWECKPSNLEKFMSTIRASGGYGPGEAVEIGLEYARLQTEKEDVSLVILIGDAPSNTSAETIQHRGTFNGGEDYWRSTKFSTPTSHLAEIGKLNSKNVPIYAFYIADYAKTSFTEIGSKSTNGKSAFLDVNSSAGADMLTDYVTESLLKKLGEANEMGQELVEQYYKLFPKTYA